MKRTLSIILLFISGYCLAQIEDDFSDGDFTENPSWSGDEINFEVDGNFELHLNAPAQADQSFLSTSSEAINNASWEFIVRMDFNPSGSNYCDVYLVSDNSNLFEDLNGYFVRIGGTEDEISLYRQDENDMTEIIDGVDDLLDTPSVNVRVRAERDDEGNWNLFADPLGNFDFALQGSIQDEAHLMCVAFGMACTYTSTRSDKFYFDEFVVVGSPFIDSIPPELNTISVINNQLLRLEFNEAIENSTAANTNNYSVNDGIGSPDNVNQSFPEVIDLSFSSAFVNGQTYIINISGLSDLAGNFMQSTSEEFMFFVPGIPDEGSVIFNEIFADPTPSQGLPEVEFIELHNRSEEVFDLEDWVLVNSSTEKLLPSYILTQNQYVLLCDQDQIDLLSGFGSVIGIPSFTALANTGDSLTIRSSTGLVLDIVVYEDSWYENSEAIMGGFSLERVNPNKMCSGQENWKVSSNSLGGSPGEQNSVFDDTPDSTAPSIASYFFESPQSLVLVFNEAMDVLSLEFGSYELNNGVDVLSSTLVGNYEDRIRLGLSEGLDPSTNYLLNVENVFDCEGNESEAINVEILLGFEPFFGDVLITEIMSDPSPPVGLPEAEYIELYNASAHLINLGNCQINDAVIPTGTFIEPGEYLIVGSAQEQLAFFAFENFVGATPWSSSFLNNSGEVVQLLNTEAELINEIAYDLMTHAPNKREGGWSLEMMNLNEACRGISNWSSSIDFQGGTPGEINSVYTEEADLQGPELLDILVNDDQSIVLVFDEFLEAANSDLISISIDNGLNGILPQILDSDLKRLQISLAPSIQEGIIYNLSIEGLSDCLGNIISDQNTGRFALPQEADPGDVIINEVLFNPPEGGTDFVEIYNRTDKVLSLKDWRIANMDNGIPGDLNLISGEGKLLFPRTYVLLSEDSQAVKNTYPNGNRDVFLSLDNFPTYSNDEGTVILMMPDAQVSDEFSYQEDYHFNLLDEVKGVSLERIDFERVTNDPSNWHSASTISGNATPGLPNSQFFQGSIPESSVALEPELFSPDNDGFDDFLNINYVFDESGYLGSINIYDSRGVPVKSLLRNEIMATSGTVKWDGTTDENTKARLGVYVIFIEIFDLEGSLSVFKKTCVVGTRF
ncbi:MAG: lamin tail domain-containing protein [Bacteroidota bacterium]